MMHADINRSRLSGATAANRRQLERHSAAAEVVIAWDHNISQRVRFRVVDMNDRGLRIAGTLPILNGMSGVAIALLPGGDDLHRLFMVRWVSDKAIAGEYHAGLEFLG